MTNTDPARPLRVRNVQINVAACRAAIVQAAAHPKALAAFNAAVNDPSHPDGCFTDFLGCSRGMNRSQVTSRPATARRQSVRGASRRSSARSGDSGDDDPSQDAGDLPAPRICTICGTDISDLRPHAKVCRQEKCRRAQGRERTKREALAAEPPRPDHTACVDCGRRWLSDLDPRNRPCPRCGGALQIGVPGIPPVERPRQIPRDPLAGVAPDIFICLTGNRGLDGPERTFVTQAPADRPIKDDQDVADLEQFRRRHAHLTEHLASQVWARREVAA